jgi:hypothetical protein
MYDHIFVGQWMILPKEVRDILIKDFNMVKTGPVEVRDEHVITDGFTNNDLSVFTAESMYSYAGEVASFGRLWELTVRKAHDKLNPPEVIGSGVIDSIIQVSDETLEVAPNNEPKAMCDTCPTKGFRHHKGCPKYDGKGNGEKK